MKKFKFILFSKRCGKPPPCFFFKNNNNKIFKFQKSKNFNNISKFDNKNDKFVVLFVATSPLHLNFIGIFSIFAIYWIFSENDKEFFLFL